MVFFFCDPVSCAKYIKRKNVRKEGVVCAESEVHKQENSVKSENNNNRLALPRGKGAAMSGV